MPAGIPAAQLSPTEETVDLTDEQKAWIESYQSVEEIQQADIPLYLKRKAVKFFQLRAGDAKRLRTSVLVTPPSPEGERIPKLAETQTRSRGEYEKFEAFLNDERFLKLLNPGHQQV